MVGSSFADLSLSGALADAAARDDEGAEAESRGNRQSQLHGRLLSLGQASRVLVRQAPAARGTIVQRTRPVPTARSDIDTGGASASGRSAMMAAPGSRSPNVPRLSTWNSSGARTSA